MNRGIRATVVAGVVAALATVTVGTAEAGGPRPAPKSECKAAARIIVAIDHGVPVNSDDLSFRGMPAYVDQYNDRLAARQPYADPAPAGQVRAWLAGQVANGCRDAVAPNVAGR